jgi:hypothetical protein
MFTFEPQLTLKKTIKMDLGNLMKSAEQLLHTNNLAEKAGEMLNLDSLAEKAGEMLKGNELGDKAAELLHTDNLKEQAEGFLHSFLGSHNAEEKTASQDEESVQDASAEESAD